MKKYLIIHIIHIIISFLLALWIHLILTWIRIRILGFTFGYSGSGSGLSDPPLKYWIWIRVPSGSRSGSEYLFFDHDFFSLPWIKQLTIYNNESWQIRFRIFSTLKIVVWNLCFDIIISERYFLWNQRALLI